MSKAVRLESLTYKSESVGWANGPPQENIRFVSAGAGLSPGTGPFFVGRC